MHISIPGLLLLAVGLAAGGPHASAHEARRCQSWLGALRQFVNHDRSSTYARLFKKGEHWGIDGEHVGRFNAPVTYNAYYAPTLNNRTLERLARERRHDGGTTHVLDLFGSAVFSREPEVFDSLTGVRLLPFPRKRLSRTYKRADHRREIVGDLTRSSTWALVDRDRRARGIAKYDYVFVRPIGALVEAADAFIGENRGAERRRAFYAFTHAFLNHAWSRLSPEGGRLFLEINTLVYDSPEFERWLRDLAGLGIEYTLAKAGGEYYHWHHVLQLIRRPADPRRLP